MKVLIVRLSSIGDIVHALPSLAAIRRSLPEAEIGWAVDRRFAEILRGNELIDHLIELDLRSLSGGNVIEELLLDITSQLRVLRKLRFDVAIDLQGLLKSASIMRYSGAPKRWGFSRRDLREPSARIFYTDTFEAAPQMHVVRRNLALVSKAFAFRDESIEFPIFTSSRDKEEATSLAEHAGREFAILNPGGGWVTKLWHAEKFGRLADVLYERMAVRSIISTGPGEDELAQRALEASRTGSVIVAQPSLKGFFELAKLAKIYVGGDTGPTHLSIAAGTPVVGIFGPTEWWRNGSLNPDDVCVERVDIGCRVDCHRRTCGNWICMDIDVETVFDAVRQRLERVGTRISAPV